MFTAGELADKYFDTFKQAHTDAKAALSPARFRIS